MLAAKEKQWISIFECQEFAEIILSQKFWNAEL